MPFYENFISLCNSIHKAPTAAIIEIGLERSSGTRWKKGGMPSDATARRIADYFGVTVDALMGDAPQSAAQPDSALRDEFARIFADLTPENQTAVLAEMLRRRREQ